jgi:hypothetical protein
MGVGLVRAVVSFDLAVKQDRAKAAQSRSISLATGATVQASQRGACGGAARPSPVIRRGVHDRAKYLR